MPSTKLGTGLPDMHPTECAQFMELAEHGYMDLPWPDHYASMKIRYYARQLGWRISITRQPPGSRVSCRVTRLPASEGSIRSQLALISLLKAANANAKK